MSGGERQVTRIGRRALGIAAAGALLVSLCRCDSGGGVRQLRAACEEPAPMGTRYWLPAERQRALVSNRDHLFRIAEEAWNEAWEQARVDAQVACAEMSPSSVGGFFSGQVRADMSWELICFTQGAWASEGTLRVSQAPIAGPHLQNVEWAGAGRVAQALCRGPAEGGEAGMPITRTGPARYRLLCLGHDTELWDVREQDVASAVRSLGDWQAAGSLAATLCDQRYAGRTGFFTGAGGAAAGTYQLACVPVRP